MVVKIRLARFGKRHQPLYNIVVAQARTARNSRPMEILGTYDPTPRVPLAIADEDSIIITPSQSDAITDATSSPSEASLVTKKRKRYKDIQLDTSRTKYWLGVGAQPSEPVWRLLALIGLIDPKPGKTIDSTID